MEKASGSSVRDFSLLRGRKNTKLGLEIYSYDRYLTVTGHILNDQLTEIVNSQVALDWLVDQYFSDSPNTRVNQTAENQRINESEVGEIHRKTVYFRHCKKVQIVV